MDSKRMGKGGQPGNNNAGKGKPWREAMDWALKNHSSNTGEKCSKVEESMALRAIATKCVDDAIEGDKDARAEVANRLDGKPTQAIDLKHSLDALSVVELKQELDKLEE